MKKNILVLAVFSFGLFFSLISCGVNDPASSSSSTTSLMVSTTTTTPQTLGSMADDVSILFLRHSTGLGVWDGGVSAWFDSYNASNSKSYSITENAYPNGSDYEWKNYPYDYWLLWVQNEGMSLISNHQTLDIMATNYEVIVFKHCFPVSSVEADSGVTNVASEVKTLANYKAQYEALKIKMHEFSDVRFVVWTGAALIEAHSSSGQAERAREFANWVIQEWDETNDNIFIWDFRELETEGGLYLLPEFATGDSHPNTDFNQTVAPLFGQRVVDVIQGRGDTGSLTGQ